MLRDLDRTHQGPPRRALMWFCTLAATAGCLLGFTATCAAVTHHGSTVIAAVDVGGTPTTWSYRSDWFNQSIIATGDAPSSGVASLIVAAACAGHASAPRIAAKDAGGAPNTLFHYTTEEGQKGILDSGQLNLSLKSVNPSDARYRNGQYLSDIAPGTKTGAQLSRSFINNPFQGARFTDYVEIDTSGLKVVRGRAGVFVVPGETPLDLTGRIVS